MWAVGSWVAMVQRARARETKGRQSPRRRKELIQPVPRKRRRDETQGQG